MYGDGQIKSLHLLRGKILKKMARDSQSWSTNSCIDLSRLPPCFGDLVAHIYRVNHRLAFYKRAHTPIIEAPNPFDEKQGWIKNQNQLLEPIWQIGPILPCNLVDVLETIDSEDGLTEVEEFEDSIEDEDDDNYG